MHKYVIAGALILPAQCRPRREGLLGRTRPGQKMHGCGDQAGRNRDHGHARR